MFRRQPRPVELRLGDHVRVVAGGKTFRMILTRIDSDLYQGSTALLTDLAHHLQTPFTTGDKP